MEHLVSRNSSGITSLSLRLLSLSLSVCYLSLSPSVISLSFSLRLLSVVVALVLDTQEGANPAELGGCPACAVER